jgi:hypothetical protein
MPLRCHSRRQRLTLSRAPPKIGQLRDVVWLVRSVF